MEEGCIVFKNGLQFEPFSFNNNEFGNISYKLNLKQQVILDFRKYTFYTIFIGTYLLFECIVVLLS